MSVTYRDTELPESKTAWGPPILAFKTWGFFGANGENYLHGGTRGRSFSVSGIAPITSMTTFDGWQDGVTGTAVIDGTTYTNVVVIGVSYGNRFTDAIATGEPAANLEYTMFEIAFLQLRT